MLMGLINCLFLFSYVSGSASFPKPLSAEEEKHYLKLYEDGDTEAKNVLIERNLRLVAHIAKKYSCFLKDTDDLISVGTIGLIKAVISFKPERGTRLATYASRCIENEILMHLRAAKKHGQDVFLQDPIGYDKEGNEVTIEDKLADEMDTIDNQVSLKIQVRRLYATLQKALRARERLIIELRYGLYGKNELTQREIAGVLGISRSYVSRIEKKALEKLFKEINKAGGE